MDELTKEIALKRATLNGASGDKPTKKYRRRGDLQPDQVSATQPNPVQADAAVVQTAAALNEANQASNADSSNGSVINTENNASKALPYTSEEIFKALRGFGAPVLYFGETLSDQLIRLRKLQLEAHDRAHGSAAGKHDNLQRAIEKEIESEMVAAHVHKGLHQGADKQKISSLDKYRQPKTREQFDNLEDYVLYFFKRLLLLWEQELADRPDEVKRSVKGKKAAATQKQTRLYIKPLLKLLKARETPTDILNDIAIIVNMAIEREYVKANDHYLRMSIGNAPWPMGVTMVGIHERKGREKIFSQSIAHVLNDETQRKYIQSIKRLLTYAQIINPNPSNTKNVG